MAARTDLSPLDEDQKRLVNVLRKLQRNFLKHAGEPMEDTEDIANEVERPQPDDEHVEEEDAEYNEQSSTDAEQVYLLAIYLLKFYHFTLYKPKANAELVVKRNSEDADEDGCRHGCRVRLSSLV